MVDVISQFLNSLGTTGMAMLAILATIILTGSSVVLYTVFAVMERSFDIRRSEKIWGDRAQHANNARRTAVGLKPKRIKGEM